MDEPLKQRDGGGGLRRVLRDRLPLLGWARRYDRLTATADLVAGLTLGLTLVPQAIAYAQLAVLPVHIGLYSSFAGTMLYGLVGTVKEVSIGPTSLMALVTLQACRGLPLQYVSLLALLAGCVVLAMAALRLGGLVSLISPAVTSAFTSGTACIIVAAQLKGLLGLSFTAETLAENLSLVYERAALVRLPDCLLSLVCCTTLLLLRKLKDLPVQNVSLKRTLWLLSISRNALVVCGATLVAALTHRPDRPPLFRLSGRVEPGLPVFAIPAFSITADNRTVPFSEMVSELGSSVMLAPVVMVLANIAIAKAFSAGKRLDATQELLALGLCNVVGACVGAMPTCGAFTRSAVSHSSGVRTPAASFYAGLVALLALALLTPYFYFIPKACLSSVLVCAVIFMVDLKIASRLWRRDRQELFVLLLTFIVSVTMTVELAVLAGVLGSAAALLRSLARAEVRAGCGGAPRPQPALLYLNCERVCAEVARCKSQQVLLDCGCLHLLDDSALLALQRLSEELVGEGRALVPFNAADGALAVLRAEPWLERRALTAHSQQDALAALGADHAPLLAPSKDTSGVDNEPMATVPVTTV